MQEPWPHDTLLTGPPRGHGMLEQTAINRGFVSVMSDSRTKLQTQPFPPSFQTPALPQWCYSKQTQFKAQKAEYLLFQSQVFHLLTPGEQSVFSKQATSLRWIKVSKLTDKADKQNPHQYLYERLIINHCSHLPRSTFTPL